MPSVQNQRSPIRAGATRGSFRTCRGRAQSQTVDCLTTRLTAALKNQEAPPTLLRDRGGVSVNMVVYVYLCVIVCLLCVSASLSMCV